MTKNNKPGMGMQISLWIGQIMLAAMFGMAGVMKTFTPVVDLAKKLPWADQVPEALVRFIGISELAGAIGLILPAFLRFFPGFLTPLASLGLAVIMALAAGFHGTRGEMSALPINAALGAVALFVTWGRFFKAPLSK
ncbi:MAG: DoxX family protein [Spirochaetia bacterium]|nr:DoxX family protein [Spirochaetia bacterium]